MKVEEVVGAIGGAAGWIVHRRRAVEAGADAKICLAERVACKVAISGGAARAIEQAKHFAEHAHCRAKALLLP